MPAKQTDRRCAPIGVFDSGLGGLSVAQEIHRHLPKEDILYFADTRHVPYGHRTDDEIRTLTSAAVDWLYQQGCKLVVVACNTASAFSLTPLRHYYGPAYPIVGLVPAVKPAAIASRSRVIGVLATPGTLRGSLLHDVIAKEACPRQVKVLTLASAELVPLIEAGQQDDLPCHQLLKEILQPLYEAGGDHLVLGCTHYPFLKQPLQAVWQDQFILVDSGQAVARQVGQRLQAEQLNRQCDTPGHLHLVSSGPSGAVRQVVPRLVDLSAWQTVSFSELAQGVGQSVCLSVT